MARCDNRKRAGAKQGWVVMTYGINCAARLLIKQRGAAEAGLAAAQRADDLLAAGDRDGHRVWMWIVAAVNELSGRSSEKTIH